MSKANYDASSITVLKGLEAVRTRPAMYIGDTDKKGLHHLAWEVLDNAVDEAMAGHCNQIQITLHNDGETLTVEDNGRGIPIDIHQDYQKEQKTALEVVLTVLHAGGKFNNDSYAGGSGGLHGVGVSCVNALSDKLTAVVWKDGGAYEQSFCRGNATTTCIRTGDSRKKGTAITFHADSQIFIRTIKFDEELLIRKCRETAFLNAGLKITFHSKKTGRNEVFQYAGGISDYVVYQTASKTGHYPTEPFFFKSAESDCTVQVAFQYTEDDDEVILSFANNIYTLDGGTHLSGFKTALTRTVNSFARSAGLLKQGDNNLSGDDVREGITAVISVRIPQPQFEGQTKAKLGSVEAESAVNSLFGEALVEFFEKNPSIAKMIIERACVSQKARESAKKHSDLIKRQSGLFKTSRLPGKLKDCASDNRAETELFIVEGDSAWGAAGFARDSKTQAVMPIRGKIINAEKNDMDSLMNNKEVQSLITAIGTGIALKNEDEFDIEKRRYDKIIFMTDADVDGSHIAILLLTFFYKFMRPLVSGGYIYIAQPPLYAVDDGKKNMTYCWTEDELEKAKIKTKSNKVTRFKGLGEMNANQLGPTTMHKATRRLVKVEIDDIGVADKVLSVLMGKNVSDRKAYIVEHSAEYSNLDGGL